MSNIINLTWNGATDDIGISGYQIQWRTSTTSPWSQPILVNHNPNSPGNTPTSGGGSYSHTITQVRDHTFRIRIIDSVGQFSAYKTIAVSVDTATILISTRNSQLNDNLVCGFPVINSILLKDNNGVTTTTIINNLTFVKNSDNTTFNGLGRFWRILLNNISYRCKIDTSGKIESHVQCSSFNVKTFSISSQGYDSNITNGPICGADLLNTIYFNNELVIGTIIYTSLNENGTLSDLFIGSNRYYLISNFDFYYIIQIQNNGSVSSIQDYTTVCQLDDPINIDICCFVKGTKITMFDYTTKNIEDIKEGEIILSVLDGTQEIIENGIRATVEVVRSELYTVTLDNGNTFTITDDHPVWVAGKGWSSVDPTRSEISYPGIVLIGSEVLSVGDVLFGIEDKPKIISIVDAGLRNESVYTIGTTNRNAQNYFANGILSHNVKVIYDPNSNLPQNVDECIAPINENDGFLD